MMSGWPARGYIQPLAMTRASSGRSISTSSQRSTLSGNTSSSWSNSIDEMFMIINSKQLTKVLLSCPP
ncbi:hypothetical protein BLOT_008706 [Blomia tropicalis]|nr:hypothetical protein BLOT_008706 [Blomia tropicalis]